MQWDNELGKFLLFQKHTFKIHFNFDQFVLFFLRQQKRDLHVWIALVSLLGLAASWEGGCKKWEGFPHQQLNWLPMCVFFKQPNAVQTVCRQKVWQEKDKGPLVMMLFILTWTQGREHFKCNKKKVLLSFPPWSSCFKNREWAWNLLSKVKQCNANCLNRLHLHFWLSDWVFKSCDIFSVAFCQSQGVSKGPAHTVWLFLQRGRALLLAWAVPTHIPEKWLIDDSFPSKRRLTHSLHSSFPLGHDEKCKKSTPIWRFDLSAHSTLQENHPKISFSPKLGCAVATPLAPHGQMRLKTRFNLTCNTPASHRMFLLARRGKWSHWSWFRWFIQRPSLKHPENTHVHQSFCHSKIEEGQNHHGFRVWWPWHWSASVPTIHFLLLTPGPDCWWVGVTREDVWQEKSCNVETAVTSESLNMTLKFWGSINLHAKALLSSWALSEDSRNLLVVVLLVSFSYRTTNRQPNCIVLLVVQLLVLVGSASTVLPAAYSEITMQPSNRLDWLTDSLITHPPPPAGGTRSAQRYDRIETVRILLEIELNLRCSTTILWL